MTLSIYVIIKVKENFVSTYREFNSLGFLFLFFLEQQLAIMPCFRQKNSNKSISTMARTMIITAMPITAPADIAGKSSLIIAAVK